MKLKAIISSIVLISVLAFATAFVNAEKNIEADKEVYRFLIIEEDMDKVEESPSQAYRIYRISSVIDGKISTEKLKIKTLDIYPIIEQQLDSLSNIGFQLINYSEIQTNNSSQYSSPNFRRTFILKK